MKDYLRVLKVKADASDKEIKDNYRRLKREYEQKKQKNKLIKLEEAYLAYLEQKKEEIKENKKEKDSNIKETKEISTKDKGQDNHLNVIGKRIVTVLSVVAIVLGLYLVSEVQNVSARINTNPLTEITFDEFLTTYAGTEDTIVMVGRPTCSWCQKYKPLLEKIVAIHGIDIKYLNIDKFTDDEKSAYLAIDTVSGGQGGIGTPITLVVSDNSIKARIDGYKEQATVENFLKENKLIK